MASFSVVQEAVGEAEALQDLSPINRTVSGTITVGGSGVRRRVFCVSTDGVTFHGSTVSAADGTYSIPVSQNIPVLIIVDGEGTDNPRIHKVTPG